MRIYRSQIILIMILPLTIGTRKKCHHAEIEKSNAIGVNIITETEDVMKAETQYIQTADQGLRKVQEGLISTHRPFLPDADLRDRGY